jgi:hypothetical protein
MISEKLSNLITEKAEFYNVPDKEFVRTAFNEIKYGEELGTDLINNRFKIKYTKDLENEINEFNEKNQELQINTLKFNDVVLIKNDKRNKIAEFKFNTVVESNQGKILELQIEPIWKNGDEERDISYEILGHYKKLEEKYTRSLTNNALIEWKFNLFEEMDNEEFINKNNSSIMSPKIRALILEIQKEFSELTKDYTILQVSRVIEEIGKKLDGKENIFDGRPFPFYTNHNFDQLLSQIEVPEKTETEIIEKREEILKNYFGVEEIYNSENDNNEHFDIDAKEELKKSFDNIDEEDLISKGIKVTLDNGKVKVILNDEKEKDPLGKDPHEPGAKLDQGKVRVGLLFNDFPRALLEVSKVCTIGAKKYTDHGWLSVPNGIQRYNDAKNRHILNGAISEIDEEYGLLHLAHEAWNTLAELELRLREIEENKKVEKCDYIKGDNCE